MTRGNLMWNNQSIIQCYELLIQRIVTHAHHITGTFINIISKSAGPKYLPNDTPYKNIAQYNHLCDPTAQRNDNVHYQSPHNPATSLTWGLSPSTYYQPFTNQLPCHQTFYPETKTTKVKIKI